MNVVNSVITPARQWVNKQKIPLTRLAIISTVLFSSLAVVPRIIQGNLRPMLLYLAYLAFIAAIALLRWPLPGLIMVMVGGMFVPFAGPGGFNVSVLGIGALLGVWLLKMVAEDRRIRLVDSRPIVPLLIFILLSIVSFGIGQFPWFSFAKQAPLDAQIGGLAIFVLSAGAFILVAHLVRELRWLQGITWVFIGFGSLYIAGRVAQWGGIDMLFQRGFSAGSVFWIWLVAIAFSQAAFNNHLKPLWRVALGGIVVASFYVAYFQASSWKSGWIPPLVSLVAILVFRYWRRALILAPIGLIHAYLLANQAIGTEEYSLGTRLDAWLIVAQIAKADPILGLGFANYYWITPLFPIRGYRVVFNSHSQYLDLLAQTGILGMAAFLWIFWEVGRLGWQLRERVPEGFPRAYVYGALGGLVGTLFAALLVDWVLPFVYNIGLNGFRASVLAWVFLGGLVSLEQVYRKGVDNG